MQTISRRFVSERITMSRNTEFIAQPASKLAVSAVVAALIVAADYWLKLFVTENIAGTEGINLIPGVIRLTYTTNSGAAWSIFQGKQSFFIILTVAVLMIVVYMLVRGYIKGWFGVISLAACIGGTIGNFIDRIRFGYVVDMFETLFVRFPIFNIADIFLTLGCIAIGIYILFFHDREVLRENLPSKGCVCYLGANSGSGKTFLKAADGEVRRGASLSGTDGESDADS